MGFLWAQMDPQSHIENKLLKVLRPKLPLNLSRPYLALCLPSWSCGLQECLDGYNWHTGSRQRLVVKVSLPIDASKPPKISARNIHIHVPPKEDSNVSLYTIVNKCILLYLQSIIFYKFYWFWILLIQLLLSFLILLGGCKGGERTQ